MTIIQFSESATNTQAGPVKNRLKRTNTSGSHAIIAYRTLSITVSENQAKGVKKNSKKNKKELSDGKYKQLNV
jgi:sodium/potassium-transporting ATPase subunit alpha